MPNSFALPALITALTVFLQVWMMVIVGRAREKYGVAAPATTGNPDFERAFRVQMNTLESTMMFLPALWVFATFLSNRWAAIVGAVWLIGRAWYAIGYQRDAAARSKGFLVSISSIAVLTLGGLYGVVRALCT
jgi:uncharacterized MAPEG superfamily protein